MKISYYYLMIFLITSTFVIISNAAATSDYSEITDLVEEYNSLIDKFDKLGTHSEQLIITQELIDEINSDLELFENIVITLQNRGYDGMNTVDIVDDQIIGTVSFFDKYSLEPLFKRQIPSGAINIFGTMGLIKEFEEGGVPISYEQQVIMLKTSSAFVGTIATFNDPSDPNDEISSGMVLAAIGAYHPSIDNMKNSELADEELISELEKLLTMDESVLHDPNYDITEFWSKSQSIIEELKKRGYELESEVLTVDNIMNPTINISKSVLTNDALPPRMQIKQGVASSDVICNDGLELVFKNSDSSPSCVTPDTAEKLIKRGWASP